MTAFAVTEKCVVLRSPHLHQPHVHARVHRSCLQLSPCMGRLSTVRAVAADSETVEVQEQQSEVAERTAGPGVALTDDYYVVKALSLKTGVKVIPHPDKVSYGGEDAYFVSTVGGGAIGVADGVGGWADSGVNPAEYSRTFMEVARQYLEGKDIHVNADTQAVQLVQSSDEDLEEQRNPQGALEAAHSATRLPGSATACVLRLNRAGSTLSAANLGDSGFALVRNGRVAFRSLPLQHFFDCPLQFGSFPDFTSATDTADDAEVYELAVQAGDVLVAGSDGLWDNAYEDELLPLLANSPEEVQRAAEAVAALASRHAQDDDYVSPYSVEALNQGFDIPWWQKLMSTRFQDGGLQLGRLRGGKLDDITVLVAYVTEEALKIRNPAAEEAGAGDEEEEEEEEEEEVSPAVAAQSENGSGGRDNSI